MLSGALNKENLTSALRAVSQKRRSGVLEVRAEEDLYQVLLQSGKIAAVSKRGETVRQSVVERLVRIGMIDADDAESLAIEETETYTRSGRIAQLDLLEEIWRLPGGRFEVHSQPFADEGFAPLNISPMQLLIDLAEDDAVRQSLITQVGAKRFETLVFEVLEQSAAQSNEERAVLSALKTPMVFQDLAGLVLQSRVDLRATLAGLVERNAVSVSTSGQAKRPEGQGRSGIIERNISPEALEAVQFDDPGDLAERWRALIQVEDQRAGLRRPDEGISRAARPKAAEITPEVEVPSVQVPPHEALSEGVPPERESEELPEIEQHPELGYSEAVEHAPEDEVTVEESAAAPAVSGPAQAQFEASSESIASSVDEPLPPEAGAKIRRLSLSLLDPERRPLIAAGIVVLYLAILGYFAPPMLDAWFAGLTRLVLEG